MNSPPRKEDGFHTYSFKTDRGLMPISKWNIPTTLGLYPTHTHKSSTREWPFRLKNTRVAIPFKKHLGSGLGWKCPTLGGGYKLHITCQLLLPTTNNCRTQVVIIVYAQSTGKPVIDKKNKRKVCMESRPNLRGRAGRKGALGLSELLWNNMGTHNIATRKLY